MSLTVLSMRQRDRLPLIAVAVETDQGALVDITGADAWLRMRMIDGTPLFYDGYPWAGNDWYVVPASITSPQAGVVTYDWTEDEAGHVNAGVIELAVDIDWPDGRTLTAPTDPHATIVMRPEILPRPGAIPGGYGFDLYGTYDYGGIIVEPESPEPEPEPGPEPEPLPSTATVTSISPNGAMSGGMVSVIVNGTGFTPDAEVVVVDHGSVPILDYVSDMQIVTNYLFPAVVGTYQVGVRNPGEVLSNTQPFYVI